MSGTKESGAGDEEKKLRRKRRGKEQRKKRWNKGDVKRKMTAVPALV